MQLSAGAWPSAELGAMPSSSPPLARGAGAGGGDSHTEMVVVHDRLGLGTHGGRKAHGDKEQAGGGS